MICIKSGLLKTEHGFFTCRRGNSIGEYDSLNCSFTVGDNPENVRQNLDIVCKTVGLKEGKLVVLDQVHGQEVLTLNDSNCDDYIGCNKLQRADAIVTSVPDLGVGILTADCAPVLFHDGKNQVIGAAHTGWRGAFSGVIESTIAAMKNIGAKTEAISAVIGPCIHRESYFVGPEMLNLFVNDNQNNKAFFQPENGKLFFDLPGYVRKRIGDAGLTDISTIDVDTFIDENFFSYRRNSLKKRPVNCGRQISVIYLKKY
ncbi:MAG: peptidoglycan editing factor PgeF [Holosporales bacterium]|nr:peptidoglycan editing factor PgeF [Holosporales bacterium]